MSTRSTPARGYAKDRAQLLRRLARLEGQVRGVARMVERDEYCVDIMQQTAALRAAVDAVTLMLLEAHISGCVSESKDPSDHVDEIMEVVRRSMGRPAARTVRPTAD